MLSVCMLTICMLKKNLKMYHIIEYIHINMGLVIVHLFKKCIYIHKYLYIVLRAKIFENFLELKLVEMHNNLKQVCICQFYHRLTWQGKGSLIIALDTVGLVSW